MGAGFSSMMLPEGGGGGVRWDGRTRMGDLPESCLAEVLLRLDPPEICRLAQLSRTFRGAAAADYVWGTKLPGNYRYLMEKAFGEAAAETLGLGKKEIFARLSRPNAFDGGNKAFWLEKNGGQIFMSISSMAFSITGIDDRRYWNYISTEESRFHTVAYVTHIWWLEVNGEVEFCFPEGTYSLFFRLHLGRAAKWLGRRTCSPEHVHGWDIKPVRFHLSTSDGQRAQSKCYLDELGAWVHYHVGDFTVRNPERPMKIGFSMIQIDCTHTKGGLCVDSVLIRPKDLGHEKYK